MSVEFVGVIAHGEKRHIVARHFRFWESFKCRVVMMSPENDPVTSGEVYLIGQSCRAGPDSVLRLLRMIKLFLASDAQTAIIFEYDSIALEPIAKVDDCLRGIVKPSLDSRFISPRYPNAPWAFNRTCALGLVAMSERYPDLLEHGEVDRWIAAMAFLGGIPILDHEPPGFSRGTIGHQDLTQARGAIWDGANFIHGIKDEAILNPIIKFHKERPQP